MTNNQESEVWLRLAKPTDTEIAPLSPEASARILSAALRANRRRRPAGFWLAAPFRVAISSVAVAAVAYCVVPRVGTWEPAEIERPVIRAAPRIRTEPETARASQADKPRPKQNILPVLPSVLPKAITPQVMLAREASAAPPAPNPGGAGRDRRSFHAVRQRTPSDYSGSPRIGGGYLVVKAALSALRSAPPDEGNMYVSVTGDNVLPPESETDDELTVTVNRDVPGSVSGSAEAAALHAVPVPSATPDPADSQAAIPVWTHVRVETGAEAVLTLTALN